MPLHRMVPPCLAGLIWLLALAPLRPAGAQCPQAELLPTVPLGQDNLGDAVALSGDTLLVGAPDGDPLTLGTGAAHVFRMVGGVWEEEAVLLAQDASPQDRFGAAVALDGDLAVIGAPQDDDAGESSGAVYVFGRFGTLWLQLSKLVAGDANAGDLFGCSVAVDGLTLLVGARRDDEAGTQAGAAYVFENSGGINWFQSAKLLGADTVTGDALGTAVSLDAGVAVVGADLHDDLGLNAGAAYVFRFDGLAWPQEDELLAPLGASTDFFGRAVAVRLDRILVGAPGQAAAGEGTGAAYVFRKQDTGWMPEATLQLADGAADDQFGSAVALREDVAVVGAILTDDGAPNAGSAVIYQRDGTTWTERTRMTACDPASGDNYGGAVAVDAGLAAVGARFHGEAGPNVGAAYVYRGLSDLLAWSDLGGELASATDDPCLFAVGSLQPNSGFKLVLDGAPPLSTAGLLLGLGVLGAPFKGGVLVPTPDLLLFPVAVDPLGELSVNGFWPPGVPSGAQLVSQFWILDPSGPVGFVASNGEVGTAP